MTGTTTRGALLALALLAGCASPGTEERTDELWIVNARIRGLRDPNAKSIHVRGGKIVGVHRGAPPSAEVIDAKGGWVLPGFHDAHVHLLSAGLEQEGVALGEASTLADAVAAVGSFARAHPEKAWIEGSGWAYGIVPKGSFPSRKDLDAVVLDRPVILSSYDGHTTWANSRALELAGVDAKTKDPAGGKIVHEADGTPQGTLLEDAGELVYRKVPKPTRDAKRAALKRAAEELAALGVTSIDDIEHDEEVLVLLHELAEKGELPVRVRLGLPIEGDVERYQELRKKYDSPALAFDFVKGFVDGVVESKTAYLLEPYVGSTERGTPQIPADRLAELVARAHRAGLNVALHAVGDAAVRISLDAFEKAPWSLERPPRDRIEHIEVLSLADAPRFAKLGVIASMQPIHATPEPESGVWSANLGPERLPRTFPWKTLADAGATLAFGSDWPVASPDPLHGLAVAVTRQNKDGHPPGGWNAHQAVSLEQALRAYSNGLTVAPGERADLVILSPDVDLGKPATLWTGHVAVTIVDGRVRHHAP